MGWGASIHKTTRTIRREFLGTGLVAVLTVMLPLSALSATLEISPPSEQPGEKVNVRGEGFTRTDDEDCRVLFDDDAQLNPFAQGGDGTPAFAVGTCHITGSGGLRGDFVVPQMPPGQYFVAVCNDCGGDTPELEAASFEVLSSETTTTTTTTSTTLPTATSSSSSTTTSTLGENSTTTTAGSDGSAPSSSTSIPSTSSSQTASNLPSSTGATTTLADGQGTPGTARNETPGGTNGETSVLGKSVEPTASEPVESPALSLVGDRQAQIWAAVVLLSALVIALVRWMYLNYWKYG